MAGGEDSTLDRRCDDHCNLLQADDGHAKRRLKRMCGQDLTQDLKENAVFELLVIEVWPAGPRSTLASRFFDFAVITPTRDRRMQLSATDQVSGKEEIRARRIQALALLLLRSGLVLVIGWIAAMKSTEYEAAVQPAAAVLATAGEVIFAIALITGFRLREAAIGSELLLAIFGISMAPTLGMKAPLDYSVFTAATAAFSLAIMAADHKREIREGGNHESTVEQ